MKISIKNRKNLFLTLVVMLTTFCVSVANVVKEKNMSDEDKLPEIISIASSNVPEEIIPTKAKEPPSESSPLIMAGKVLPPKDGEKIEPYKDDDMTPLAGEVVPAVEVGRPNSAGIIMAPVSQNLNEPPSFAGDIPPSWVIDHHPQKKSKGGFFKSLINKFKKDKY